MIKQSGTLFLRPLYANLTPNAVPHSVRDTYCIISLGSESFYTEVSRNSGFNPDWRDVLEFRDPTQSTLFITLHQKNPTGPDFEIAQGSYDIGHIFQRRHINDSVELMTRLGVAGQLQIDILFRESANHEVRSTSSSRSPPKIQTSPAVKFITSVSHHRRSGSERPPSQVNTIAAQVKPFDSPRFETKEPLRTEFVERRSTSPGIFNTQAQLSARSRAPENLPHTSVDDILEKILGRRPADFRTTYVSPRLAQEIRIQNINPPTYPAIQESQARSYPRAEFQPLPAPYDSGRDIKYESLIHDSKGLKHPDFKPPEYRPSEIRYREARPMEPRPRDSRPADVRGDLRPREAPLSDRSRDQRHWNVQARDLRQVDHLYQDVKPRGEETLNLPTLKIQSPEKNSGQARIPERFPVPTIRPVDWSPRQSVNKDPREISIHELPTQKIRDWSPQDVRRDVKSYNVSPRSNRGFDLQTGAHTDRSNRGASTEMKPNDLFTFEVRPTAARSSREMMNRDPRYIDLYAKDVRPANWSPRGVAKSYDSKSSERRLIDLKPVEVAVPQVNITRGLDLTSLRNQGYQAVPHSYRELSPKPQIENPDPRIRMEIDRIRKEYKEKGFRAPSIDRNSPRINNRYGNYNPQYETDQDTKIDISGNTGKADSFHNSPARKTGSFERENKNLSRGSIAGMDGKQKSGSIYTDDPPYKSFSQDNSPRKNELSPAKIYSHPLSRQSSPPRPHALGPSTKSAILTQPQPFSPPRTNSTGGIPAPLEKYDRFNFHPDPRVQNIVDQVKGTIKFPIATVPTQVNDSGRDISPKKYLYDKLPSAGILKKPKPYDSPKLKKSATFLDNMPDSFSMVYPEASPRRVQLVQEKFSIPSFICLVSV